MKSRIHFVVTPRLLDIQSAAVYLSVSEWTLRSWIADGLLAPVELPSVRNKREKNRRLLFDRLALDSFVDARRSA